MARILVTGSKGFIGKNLVAELDNRGFDVFECGRETSNEVLEGFCKDADFVFHLAGVNRPSDPEEFIEGNVVFTSKLLETLKKNRNFCPVVFSSSIQATQDSPYGLSKRMGEKLVFEHGRSTRSPVLVYRLPNVFGKWCKPDYNSVIATFCYNISRDIPIKVTDPDKEINLVYIDDLVGEFINAIKGNENRNEEFCEVQPIHTITLSKIADLIYSFRQSRVKVSVPDMSNPLTKKLYSTYLSYLPENQFGYTLKTNVDFRVHLRNSLEPQSVASIYQHFETGCCQRQSLASHQGRKVPCCKWERCYSPTENWNGRGYRI